MKEYCLPEEISETERTPSFLIEMFVYFIKLMLKTNDIFRNLSKVNYIPFPDRIRRHNHVDEELLNICLLE